MLSGAMRAQVVLTKSLFGKDKPTHIEVYDDGLKLISRNEVNEHPFESIEKIGAYNFYGINKNTILQLKIANEKKVIELGIPFSKDKSDEKIILSIHRDFLLGNNFPTNLASLDLALGFLGSNGGVCNGEFKLGNNTFPFSDLESFALDTRGATGGVYVKLKSSKIRFMIKPEEAVNILASMDILNAIREGNLQ